MLTLSVHYKPLNSILALKCMHVGEFLLFSYKRLCIVSSGIRAKNLNITTFTILRENSTVQLKLNDNPNGVNATTSTTNTDVSYLNVSQSNVIKL